MISVQGIYEPRSEDDGERYLVERLWPRGVSREVASLTGLRAPESQPLLVELAEKAQREKVTLVFAARDGQHNSALVLKAFIEKHYAGQGC